MALMFVKSKPALMSCQEYFELLTSYMKDEPRPNDAKATKQYVDEAAMWHHAYLQSEEIQLALQARILELEGLQEASTGEIGSLALKSLRKRRREANEPSEASGSRSQKTARVAASASAARCNGANLGKDAEDNERPATAVLGDPILRGLYILQQTLAQKKSEPPDLAATLCQTASSICRYVSEVQWIQGSNLAVVNLHGNEAIVPRQPITTHPQAKEGEFVARLAAIGQIFPKLLAGLDRLILLPKQEVLEDRVVYTYVEIFQVLLQQVCIVASAHAKERLAEPKARELANTVLGSPPAPSANTPCSTCRNRELKCDNRRPKCRNCSRLKQVCRNKASTSSAHTTVQTPGTLPLVDQIIKLCELVITMVGCLDVGKQAHAKVLEGFLCILFEEVGHGLKRFVFGSEDDGLPPERDRNRPSTNHDGQEDDEAIEARAPYLVWILKHSNFVLSQHDSSDQPNQSPLRAGVDNIAMLARNRLQNTLLKSVFGREASIEFEPSLPPLRSLTVTDIMGLNLPPAESKNWFKHEVWQIVGWDVLRNHIKWC